jgi:hypothetical protein
MATYAVSFDIHYNTTYSERYQSLMAEIHKCSRVWEETTSFCLCETSESLDIFQQRLYMSRFDPGIDKMLVMDVKLNASVVSKYIESTSTLRSGEVTLMGLDRNAKNPSQAHYHVKAK